MDLKGEKSVAADPAVPGLLRKDNPAVPGLSRKDIFVLMRDKLNSGAAAAYKEIEKAMSEKLERPFRLSDDVKSVIRRLLSDFNAKWKTVSRHEDKFLKKFSEWLSVFVPLEETPGALRKSSNIRRPSVGSFESSERTKRRKIEEFRAGTSAEESSRATHMSLRAAGKLDGAKVLEDITLGNPTMASEYRQSLRTVAENCYSDVAALSLLIENRMSKHLYQAIRSGALEHNSKLYPSYKSVMQAKKKCYPPRDDISITETSAEVRLQALLDHTVNRILSVQGDVLTCLSSGKISKLNFTCKWGCNETSRRSILKRKSNNDDENKLEATIFFTWLVPLQLMFVDEVNKKDIIIWKNPRPSSSRFCRPIKIEFLKETAERTRNEVNGIEKQANQLASFLTVVNGKEINVTYELASTMGDGKVRDSSTSTASNQRCTLCGSTSKDFNDIDEMLEKKINEDQLENGVSSPHAWILLFECLLDISYKLGIEKWQSDKKSVESRTKTIQKGLRQKLGLLIDEPKQGFGSTNDVDTARRFFQNSRVSASITGLDEDLIKRFHVILQVISCAFEINVEKFEEYTVATARRFVLLYHWYDMRTTVHELLIHGARIVELSMLPIGEIPEEAQEACDKYMKSFGQDFPRKCSRKEHMENVFSRLLIASDPVISSLRKLPANATKSLSREAVALLKSPAVDKNEPILMSDSSDTDYDSDPATDYSD